MIFKELTKIANIGTERISTDLSLGNDKLSELLKTIEYKNPEEKILNYAAFLTTYQEAGKTCQKLEDFVDIDSPEKEKKPVTKVDRNIINKVLADNINPEKIQREFFERLDTKYFILPEDCIVTTLNLGAKNKNLQPIINKVIGNLGLFLAKQNKNWNYVYSLKQPLEKTFEEGNIKVKCNVIKNADATQHSEIVTYIKKAWDKFKKEEKSEILHATGELGEFKSYYEDIYILATEDKNNDTQQNGINYLKQLRNYPYYEDIYEEVCKLLETSILIKKEKTKYKIEVYLPTKYDAKILDKFNIKEVKNLNMELFFYDLQRALPLSYWEERLNLSVEELVELFEKNKLSSLLNTLNEVIIIQKNEEWAKVFYERKIMDSNYMYNRIIDLLADEYKDSIFDKKITALLEIKNLTDDKIISEDVKKQLADFSGFFVKYSAMYSRKISYYASMLITDLVKVLLERNLLSGHELYFRSMAYVLDENIHLHLKKIMNEEFMAKVKINQVFNSFFDVIETRYKMLEEL